MESKVYLQQSDKECLEFFIPAEDREEVIVIRKGMDSYGIIKYLLEYNGFRGWLEDGIPYRDIQWKEEWLDGWPEGYGDEEE